MWGAAVALQDDRGDRSATAAMVRDGLSPTASGTIDPSATYRSG